MHLIWGLLMIAAGLFMLVCGTTRSEFIIYRLMVARSRILWGDGDAVHHFYQVSGLIVTVLGILWAWGAIWSAASVAEVSIFDAASTGSIVVVKRPLAKKPNAAAVTARTRHAAGVEKYSAADTERHRNPFRGFDGN